jgi:hypothetical protein
MTRRLTQRELQALKATPGFVVRKVDPSGHSRVEELVTTVRGNKTTKLFASRLEPTTREEEE